LLESFFGRGKGGKRSNDDVDNAETAEPEKLHSI
jgi:hypothetical protein